MAKTDAQAITQLNGLSTEASNKKTEVLSAFTGFDDGVTSVDQDLAMVSSRVAEMNKTIQYALKYFEV